MNEVLIGMVWIGCVGGDMQSTLTKYSVLVC